MIWDYLRTSSLQQKIGDQLLKQIEEIMPILDKDFDPTTLYKKQQLIKLFQSFLDYDVLKNNDFRKNLLMQIPEEKLNELLELIDIAYDNFNFSQKVS